MTMLEMVDEVYERTHVDRVEIFSRARAAWPGAVEFKPCRCVYWNGLSAVLRPLLGRSWLFGKGEVG